MSILFAVLFVIIKQVNSYDDSYGHYDDEGTQCTLQSQSPIDIEFDDLPECSLNNEYPNEIYLDLKLRDPSLTKFIVKNDGYSLYAIPFTTETDNPKEIHEIHVLHESEQAVFSFGNPLNGTYESNTNTRYCFDSIHFHWGSDDSKGSEHTFNGKQTPLEAHFVSYSCDYSDVRTALKAYTDGAAKDKYILGVIGVQFDVGEGNPALDKMLNPLLIDRIREYGSYTPGVIRYNYAYLNITDLIPGYSLANPDKSLTSMAMYYGSLTTPPCYESIRWYVMKTKLTVSEEQLYQFRRMLNKKNKSSSNNYREVLPLNNRTVYNCEYQIMRDQYVSDTKQTNDSDIFTPGVIAAIAFAAAALLIIVIVSIWCLCRSNKSVKKPAYSPANKDDTASNASIVTRQSVASQSVASSTLENFRKNNQRDGVLTVTVNDVPVSKDTN